MHEVAVIEDPAAAVVSLNPVRVQLLTFHRFQGLGAEGHGMAHTAHYFYGVDVLERLFSV
jgi:hypothetical protein